MSPIQWHVVIKVDGGTAGDVGNDELRLTEPGEYSLGDNSYVYFYCRRSRSSSGKTVAAALAEFAYGFLFCQFKEPLKGFPNPLW